MEVAQVNYRFDGMLENAKRWLNSIRKHDGLRNWYTGWKINKSNRGAKMQTKRDDCGIFVMMQAYVLSNDALTEEDWGQEHFTKLGYRTHFSKCLELDSLEELSRTNLTKL